MIAKKNKNKGQVLVLFALSLIVILGFAALAIDVAYFYHTKNQLQGAADAAALAGAAELDGTANTNQAVAIFKTYSFAYKNTAAKSPVVLETASDITIGYWNGTDVVSPSGNQISNAVKVRARRSTGSPGGPITTFFGKIFGIDYVNISVTAIAAKPAKGTINLAFCTEACSSAPPFTSYSAIPLILGGPKVLKPGNSGGSNAVPPDQQLAWANLANQPSTSTNALREAICTGPSYKDVCDENLYSTMASPSPLLPCLKSVFLDPNYDEAAKEVKFLPYSGVNAVQQIWWVVIPVVDFDYCPVTVQGALSEPKKVVQYAVARVIGVCPDPDMNPQAPCKDPLPSSNNLICDVQKYKDAAKDYKGIVVIDRIACLDCANKNILLGPTARLVE